MSSDVAIATRGLGKAYRIYDQPADRLKQMFFRNRAYYREFWALRGIDLEVRAGETVGIIGRNGAGKSTLLQLISGTVAPTEGTVGVHGRVAALLTLGTGFNLEFTGRENIFVNAAVLGLTDAEIRSRLDAIIDFADIGRFIDQPARTYSSGMYARLAFAVAMHVDPQVLIVDEILAVGDAPFQRKCIQKFHEIQDRGCTILFVSHDPYQVKTVCRRALYLAAGEAVAFGDVEEVVDRYVQDIQNAAPAPTARPTAIAPAAGPVEEPPPRLIPPPFQITSVTLENAAGDEIDVVESGQDVQLRMRYETITDDPPSRVTFVVNLYRQDDLYVCGSTTLMDGLEPVTPGDSGEVVVRFPGFPLLAGEYQWRVAINDDRGFVTHVAVMGVCPTRVTGGPGAIGLVDLQHRWDVHTTVIARAPLTAREGA